MKELKNVEGAKMLSKMEQKIIKGGTCFCETDDDCPEGYYCDWRNQITGLCLKKPIEL
ncbi:MAG: hypothetical protein GQ564_15240 [Bacteroidales bacterium]|nr:hypothetical protein [Bacteroidales bacterium]